jgi:2-keto-3-deoxy-L-rhamnonate aldolase RhmA
MMPARCSGQQLTALPTVSTNFILAHKGAIMVRNRLRQRLRDHQTAYGLWVTVESPTITEIAVALALDWVCIDMEHGHLDYRDVMDHLRAVRGSTTNVIVRVPELQMSAVKRVLDMGAHGVILPYARSRDEVATAMSYGRYPPAGIRGIGGERAFKWGLGFQEYLSYADEETLLIPLIETREAVAEIDEILSIPGLEAIFFGPADLSASYGHLGSWDEHGIAEVVAEVKGKAAAKGIGSGILARGIADAVSRRDQGFQMVALGADMTLLVRAIRETLEQLGRDTTPQLWF